MNVILNEALNTTRTIVKEPFSEAAINPIPRVIKTEHDIHLLSNIHPYFHYMLFSMCVGPKVGNLTQSAPHLADWNSKLAQAFFYRGTDRGVDNWQEIDTPIRPIENSIRSFAFSQRCVCSCSYKILVLLFFSTQSREAKLHCIKLSVNICPSKLLQKPSDCEWKSWWKASFQD